MQLCGITKSKISFYSKKNVNNFSDDTSVPIKSNNTKKIFLALGGLAVLGAVTCLIALKKGAPQEDLEYKKILVKALNEEGVNCSVKDLKSIMGIDELRKLLPKYKSEHFQAGQQISKILPVDEFYKNAVDGNFRISLHTHSNFSDGKATPAEFLECANKYANKVASMNKNDDLPPFVIALTDHDNIDGVKEIIRMIAQNPKEYKNLKFVTGAEFSCTSKLGHHDLTALAFNPFDKTLNNMVQDLKNSRTKTLQEFLNSTPLFEGKKITIEDLEEFEKEKGIKSGKPSKQTIKNRAGVVFVRHAIKFYFEKTNREVQHELLNQCGDKDILPIEIIIKNVKNAGGQVSLTHPIKSFWRYIGDDNLMYFKKLGVDGIEANHQYTPSKIVELGNKTRSDPDVMLKSLTQAYTEFANKNSMFISGGTDCHEKQVFSREPKITTEFLNEKILK